MFFSSIHWCFDVCRRCFNSTAYSIIPHHPSKVISTPENTDRGHHQTRTAATALLHFKCAPSGSCGEISRRAIDCPTRGRNVLGRRRSAFVSLWVLCGVGPHPPSIVEIFICFCTRFEPAFLVLHSPARHFRLQVEFCVVQPQLELQVANRSSKSSSTATHVNPTIRLPIRRKRFNSTTLPR